MKTYRALWLVVVLFGTTLFLVNCEGEDYEQGERAYAEGTGLIHSADNYFQNSREFLSQIEYRGPVFVVVDEINKLPTLFSITTETNPATRVFIDSDVPITNLEELRKLEGRTISFKAVWFAYKNGYKPLVELRLMTQKPNSEKRSV